MYWVDIKSYISGLFYLMPYHVLIRLNYRGLGWPLPILFCDYPLLLFYEATGIEGSQTVGLVDFIVPPLPPTPSNVSTGVNVYGFACFSDSVSYEPFRFSSTSRCE